MKKQALRLILSFLSVAVLLGMTGGIVLAKKIKVGLSLQTLNCPYYVEMKRVAEAEAKKLGAEITVLDAQQKIDKQLSDVEDLISQKCDVLMLEPVDPVGAIACVKAANKAGIPIMAFNNTMKITPDIKVETTVVADFFDIARLAGRYAAKLIGRKKVPIVMINGFPGVECERQRKFGALRGIAEYQLENYNSLYINVIAQGWGNWSYEGGLAAMEDILAAHPGMKNFVIISQNDTMALGALKAVEEAGRLNDLMFLAASADAQKEGIEAIMKGYYQGKYVCSGKNWPGVVTILGVDIAVKIAKGKRDWPSIIHPKSELVTKENAEEYYNPNAGF